ncbi:hypothetical protein MXB_4183 [Myxobolus squamalis]|nr:hypothetical protein MXB_4183 [Myxobolus squamalis]
MIKNGLTSFKAQDPGAERFSKVPKSVNGAIVCYTIFKKKRKGLQSKYYWTSGKVTRYSRRIKKWTKDNLLLRIGACLRKLIVKV